MVRQISRGITKRRSPRPGHLFRQLSELNPSLLFLGLSDRRLGNKQAGEVYERLGYSPDKPHLIHRGTSCTCK